MNIDQLSDMQAVAALHHVAGRWLEKDGLTAHVAIQSVQDAARKKGVELPPWAFAAPKPNKTNAALCRAVLTDILAGNEAKAREWVRAAVARVTASSGHALDPSLVLLGGFLLIGLVLAARVRKLRAGKIVVDFYKGVPKDVADIVEATAAATLPKLGHASEDNSL